MSPKIGLSVDVLPFSLRPVGSMDMVRAAIRHMRSQGIRIYPGDYGVSLTLSGGWEVDFGRRPGPGVSPAGAVLLAWQPMAGAREDLDVVAARVLGTSPAYVVGISDGFDGVRSERPEIQRRIYDSGVEDGRELRRELTEVCDCGTRRLYWEPCPSCEDAALDARDGRP